MTNSNAQLETLEQEFIGTASDGEDIKFSRDDVTGTSYECDDSYLVNDSAEQDHATELNLFLDFVENVGTTEYVFVNDEKIALDSVTPDFTDGLPDFDYLTFTDANPYRNYRELNVSEYIKESVDIAGGFEQLTKKLKERVGNHVDGYPSQE